MGGALHPHGPGRLARLQRVVSGLAACLHPGLLSSPFLARDWWGADGQFALAWCALCSMPAACLLPAVQGLQQLSAGTRKMCPTSLCCHPIPCTGPPQPAGCWIPTRTCTEIRTSISRCHRSRTSPGCRCKTAATSSTVGPRSLPFLGPCCVSHVFTPACAPACALLLRRRLLVHPQCCSRGARRLDHRPHV